MSAQDELDEVSHCRHVSKMTYRYANTSLLTIHQQPVCQAKKKKHDYAMLHAI